MSKAIESHPRVSPLPVVRVQPSRGWVSLGLGELFAYHELLYFLTWRDIKIRYKQTILGAAWAILQPLLLAIVFTLFFGRIANIGSYGLPYMLSAYSALVPWTFFANGITLSANSLVGNANLITKVYFPRLAVPIANVLSGLVDFAIAFAILIGMMVVYDRLPGVEVLAVPAFVLLALVTALGVGLWLSALNVRFRDVRYVLPFIVQFWLFATPIAYPSTQVFRESELLGNLWTVLNPMVGVVDGLRWALFGIDTLRPVIFLSAVTAFTLLFSGAYYFRRMEKSFADIV